MKSAKEPATPDPNATAAAQSAMNIDTAKANQAINMIDQVGPNGSLTYSQNGTTSYVDSTGKTVTVPKYTATTSYSPDQQEIFNLNNATEKKIGQIGLAQAGKIGDLLGTPIDLNNEATEARLWELGSKRLNPEFAASEENLRTRLANQGLRPGSAAWDAEMRRLGENQNDARNQLLLTGRGQAVQEALTERNQPINEISALMSGSQVNQPNFVNTPQSSVGGVDYAGLVNQNYQAKLAAANQKNAQKNAMLGGLFGIAGAGLSAFA